MIDREALIDAGRYVDEINRERDRYLAGLITLEDFEERVGDHLRTQVTSLGMTPTASTPILRGADDFERELVKTRRAIERREGELEALRATRNQLIYEGCEAGLTERKAALAAGVSYGYAGQAHRGKGDPAAGKR